MNTLDKIVSPRIKSILDQKQFFLFHDRKGKIIKTVAYPEFNPLQLFAEIMQEGNLSAFFDMSCIKQTDDNDRITLPGIKRNVYPFYFATYYSNFPLHNLITQEVGNNLYLARIAISEFAPAIQLQNGFGIFFANYLDDTLEIFESNAYALLQKESASPESLLGQPLSHFLSPTPLEFQKQNIAPFSMKDIDQYRSSWEINCSNHDPDLTLFSGFEKIDFEPHKGWYLHSSLTKPLILRLPIILNSSETDVVFSVTCKLLKGAGVFLAIGTETKGDEAPDSSGYVAGTAQNIGSFMLKRDGFTTTRSVGNHCNNGIVTYSFCKKGKSFFFFVNDKKVLGFFDEAVIESFRTQLSFGLRAESACQLVSVMLYTKKLGAQEKSKEPSQYIAQVVQKPDHFCLLSRFQNNALSSSWQRPLAGYYPIDISAMQKTIRRQEKKTHVMDTLLKNYEKREVEFIGSSAIIQKVRETALALAKSDTTVLIEGATGSGKEVLANYIHFHSLRKDGPFIKIDCGTIPKELVESSLFGHEKGAFTGAFAQNKGLFESADKGTLFIDEVGNLSLDVQAKLLRFFNDFTIMRIGGNKTLQVNVRCILASNKSLRDMVLAGTFRADLFYRINVVTMILPLLKDRQGDIVELSQYYLRRFSALNGKHVTEFEPEALNLLRNYSWPGNIRDLKNVIERAVIFSSTETITPDLIRFSDEKISNKKGRIFKPRGLLSLSRTDPERINTLLERHGGNVSVVAKTLGVGRVSLHLYLKKHNINANDYRKGY